MTQPRYKFSEAIAVVGDTVVVAAGTGVGAYDPGTGRFRALTGTQKWRSSPTATALLDGSVLIVGGYDENIRVHGDALVVHL